MKVTEFDYELPPELIAQHPLPRRDDSRMMIVDRKTGDILHSEFRSIAGFFDRGDVLVLNDTKVIPAKAWGRKADVSVEFLFLAEKSPGAWEVLCRPARRVRRGDRVVFPGGYEAEVVESGPEGKRVMRFDNPDIRSFLDKAGFAPLPPYIKRPKENYGLRSGDIERYQTVFAAKEGAIAAPTAGLHFTDAVLAELEAAGVVICRITLEVGLATFHPVRVKDVEEHRMLEESYEVSPAAALAVNRSKKENRKITAVGTTAVRTLESSRRNGEILPGKRRTSLFIYPGYRFQAIDRLLTNFHLPQSTLLMLVAAFAGHELIMRAYREAVQKKYRFFSYGDCMLIL